MKLYTYYFILYYLLLFLNCIGIFLLLMVLEPIDLYDINAYILIGFIGGLITTIELVLFIQ